MRQRRWHIAMLLAASLVAPLLIGVAASAAADPSAGQNTLEEQLKQEALANGRAIDTPQFDGAARLETPAPTGTAPSSVAAEKQTCSAPGEGASGKRYIICDGPGESKPKLAPDGTGGLSSSGISHIQADPLPLPNFCYTYAYQGWVNYREVACSISSRTALIIDAETREPLGGIDYLLADYAFTSHNIPTFARQVIVSVFGGWGLGLSPGTTVEGTITCDGVCVPSVRPFGPEPATNDTVASGLGVFPTTVVVPGEIGYANTSVTYFFTNPEWVPFPLTASSPPLIRCDNALPGNNTGIGCVFPNHTPVMQYARDGSYPELARHIGDAQGSDLPGAYPSGPPLTRLTDPALRDANGDRACPRRYTRPDTKTCDEYPFRSSYQGASTANPQGPARTFDWCQIPEPAGSGPVGYSVCMIDATQNSSGGLALLDFYNSQRVLDRDAFRVWITGSGQGPNPNPPDYPPVVDAGPDVSGHEGTAVDLAGTATDDHGNPTVHWSYTAGSDVDAGAICFFGNDAQAATTFRCTDDGTYTVTLSGDDGIHDYPSTDSAIVRLDNVDPRMRRNTPTAVAAEPELGIVSPQPWQVFRVGDPVTLTTNFTDDGANDTHTCAIGWDDGTSSSAPATGYVCGGTHTYTHAGMYTITPAITDDDGGKAEPTSVLVIVYDPDAGFATGAGHFTSAPGSLTGNPTASGMTHFQFNPKYLPHDTGPRPGNGKADLRMDDTDFQFESTELAWLVVTPDHKVAVSGTGTVNGKAGYGFVVYGYDTGRYRMVVWDLATGAYPKSDKVYDNRPSTEYDLDVADPQPIDNGNIQIH